MGNGCLEDVAFKMMVHVSKEDLSGDRVGPKDKAYWFSLYAECLRAVKQASRESES